MATIPTPTLVDQAKVILEAATSLQQQLEQRGLPQPGFEADSRKDWQDAIDYPELLRTRSALIDASNQMLNLALGPMDTLASLAGVGISKTDVFRTLNALGVADAVPLSGSIGIDSLAAQVGVDVRLLEKQLRFAYLMGLFYEPEPGRVAHTSLSAGMPEMSAWASLRLSPLCCKAAWAVPEALRTWRESPVPEGHVQVPFSLADPQERDFWTALQQDDPDGRGMEKFSAAMKAMFAGHTFVNGFDWASLGGGLVVDVGGGNGHVEMGILDDVPSGVNFLIQDLPANEQPFRELAEKHGALDRVQFQKHDFFQPQPADLKPQAYILSRILHDWQDDNCVRILRHLVPAMVEHGTKLFVVERALPSRIGDVPNHKEQLMRAQDLLMFNIFGGGERSMKEWERLFQKADGRLKIAKVGGSEISPFSYMEVVASRAEEPS
ncbi:S-adenosyl-L-methionine-dependent methyltransferase [Xylariomycetidae sp. FL2044]|nr:S-adenosyl-L-methionine-dependent methyltransferase [Xylariomycetidae sp. FL2044]